MHATGVTLRAVVERLRGMFAFALWDRNQQTFFMARDRLGVKPMYYAVLDDGTLLFGSELKSLLAYEDRGSSLKRDIDPYADNSMQAYQAPQAVEAYRDSAVFMELRLDDGMQSL